MVWNREKLFLILISIVVAACNNDRNVLPDVVYLDCQNAKSRKAGNLSDLLKDIRYVALETKDTCLLNGPTNIVLTDKYIVLDGGHESECFVFDKRDGKYLRTIGMRGDQGPMGYDGLTNPLYVVGNELFLIAEHGEKYRVFSLDNGSLLRTINGTIEGHQWPHGYLYPLNDSTMLQYADNTKGNCEYGLQVGTWSGEILKRFPSTNNFKKDGSLGYLVSYPPEINIYRYNGQVYYHEFTSDTIFRLTDKLGNAPVYVVGKGDRLPVPEMRNEVHEDDYFKQWIKFDYMLETDRYLLMKNKSWNNEAFIYDKQTKQTSHLKAEQAKGFVNDLNGFLPFWPIDRGRGDAENEVWAVLQPDEYMDGVEATGKNPLGMEIDPDGNPIVVIGTLK